jgi:hypothetical protein
MNETMPIVQPSQEVMLPQNVQSEVEKTRVLQEVQAMVLVARQCPRDEQRAIKRIMESAKRKSLAENAIYCYPRGGQTVTGASIRTAETIAKYWGNLTYGIKELSRDEKAKTSEMMAYCWDLENNVRAEKVFKVKHTRNTKKGSYTLDDERDIYELTANYGTRRLRACILNIIPDDVVEDFLEVCQKTIAGSNDKPLKERIREMIKAFEKIGVTQNQIEKRIGTKADNFIEYNLVALRGIYKSISDNFAKIEDYFEPEKVEYQESVLKVGENDDRNR